MVWITTIPWTDAEGVLREAYDWQAERLGAPAEFTQLGSLYPEIVYERLRMYRAVEGCPSGLSDVERQAAALATSAVNRTAHCASGLRLKLGALGADAAWIDAMWEDPDTAASGDGRLDAIVRHAVLLSRRPGDVRAADLDALRAHGLSDLDLLDLNNMVAYYNYVNRVANGLGLHSEMLSLHEATRALPGEASPAAPSAGSVAAG
jgi:uncharacterized peroxidase-related enzyme